MRKINLRLLSKVYPFLMDIEDKTFTIPTHNGGEKTITVKGEKNIKVKILKTIKISEGLFHTIEKENGEWGQAYNYELTRIEK